MKKLLVLYGVDDFHQEAPFVATFTRSDLERFTTYATQANVAVVKSSPQHYDPDLKGFSRYWSFADGQWQQLHDLLQPDCIWDKAWQRVGVRDDLSLFSSVSMLANHFPYFNPPYFNLLFRNKLSQYLAFAEYMPKSLPARTVRELNQAISSIPGEKIVIKPLFGMGGEGIYIGPKKFEAIARFYLNDFSVCRLVQEYVPALCEQGHIRDYRLVCIGAKGLVYALSRVAEPNSVFTNVAQGASKEHIPLDEVDPRFLVIAKAVSSKMSLWQDIVYSIDFMLSSENKPYLIEVNTSPGFSCAPGKEHYYTAYFNGVLELSERLW